MIPANFETNYKAATRKTPRWLKAPLLNALLIGTSVAILSGCAATTRDVDPRDTIHYDANYDFSDKNKIVDDLTNSLLNAPPLQSDTDQPVLIIYGVSNQTSEHIDTGGITDDMRLALMQSGRYRFLSKTQRDNIATEVAFQKSGAVNPNQIVRLGQQSGADYILGGTLRSIEKKQPRQQRLNKRKLVYYSLNMELTSLETGEVAWADKVDLAREASQPILRW